MQLWPTPTGADPRVVAAPRVGLERDVWPDLRRWWTEDHAEYGALPGRGSNSAARALPLQPRPGLRRVLPEPVAQGADVVASVVGYREKVSRHGFNDVSTARHGHRRGHGARECGIHS